MSESGFRQGSAVLARPFVGGAWQRFALVPSDVILADRSSSAASTTIGVPNHAAPAKSVLPVSVAGGGAGEAEAPATAPKSLPLVTPAIAPVLSPNYYHLPLPPNSTPALQRLRSLLQQVRDECDHISEVQRVSMTLEISALQSQIPLEYQPQFLEVLRLLARNSRIQVKSPRPPYFICNAAAPTPAVTPLNEFFNDLQVPGLSTYNVIASNIACVRMPPSALSHMDPEVLQLARRFHPALTDVFFVVVDGRVLQDYITAQRPINIIAHRWVHHQLRHGGHAASRVKMIIKSQCGVAPSNHQDFAVPFAVEGLYQTDLDVYSHENEHGPVPANSQAGAAPDAPAFVRERVALYSPNNCWFHIIPGSPYAFFTLCVFDGHRACICTMLVLLDFEEVFCKHVISALRNAPSLPSLHHLVHEFQEALNAVRISFDSITSRGQALVGASSPKDSLDQAALVAARSMVRFNVMKLLPANIRQRVFHFAWVLKGRPQNIHHDFGRMSFFCSSAIAAEHHCSTEEALECARLAANDLVHNLEALVSQLRSVDPLPLHSSQHNIGVAQLLFQAACRVFDNPLPPMRPLLHGLDHHHVDVIFHQTWRHIGHVQGDRVGELEFLSESGSPMLKFHALVDSAMHCVYMALHESNLMSIAAQQRSNERVANSHEASPETERVTSDHPPSFLAPVQATLSSVPDLSPVSPRSAAEPEASPSASAVAGADTSSIATESRIR